MEGAPLLSWKGQIVQDNRISAKQAEYMELYGAEKEGDCRKVKVSGGISKARGCCDYYDPETEKTNIFNCGHCSHHTDAVEQYNWREK